MQAILSSSAEWQSVTIEIVNNQNNLHPVGWQVYIVRCNLINVVSYSIQTVVKVAQNQVKSKAEKHSFVQLLLYNFHQGKIFA